MMVLSPSEAARMPAAASVKKPKRRRRVVLTALTALSLVALAVAGRTVWRGNEAALGPLAEIARRPRGRHVNGFGFHDSLPHFNDLMRLDVYLIQFRLLVHAHEGDLAAALTDAVVELNLGRTLADEPITMSQW